MQNRPTLIKAAALEKSGDYLHRFWPRAVLLCGVLLTAVWMLLFGYGVFAAVGDLLQLF